MAFVFLFPWFVRAYGLMGVVVARGIAWSLATAFGFWVVTRRLPVRPRIPAQYGWLVASCVLLALVRYFRPDVLSGLYGSLLVFASAGAGFLVLGGYRPTEFRKLRIMWAGAARAGESASRS